MQKNLYLFRGLPGAGKTFSAETLAKALGVEIFSADDYFTDENGEYKFDINKIKNAHLYCRNRTEERMKMGDSHVLVANTFTQEWEMSAYLLLASQYGYVVHSFIVENRHGNSNVHNCPIESIERMKNRFEIKLI